MALSLLGGTVWATPQPADDFTEDFESDIYANGWASGGSDNPITLGTTPTPNGTQGLQFSSGTVWSFGKYDDPAESAYRNFYSPSDPRYGTITVDFYDGGGIDNAEIHVVGPGTIFSFGVISYANDPDPMATDPANGRTHYAFKHYPSLQNFYAFTSDEALRSDGWHEFKLVWSSTGVVISIDDGEVYDSNDWAGVTTEQATAGFYQVQMSDSQSTLFQGDMNTHYFDNFAISGSTGPVLLEGDANRDGVVSAGDYASVQSNFGNTGEHGIPGDANGDGVVSAGDYASVQANFGSTSAPAEITPEPATMSLLVMGSLAFIRRKRK